MKDQIGWCGYCKEPVYDNEKHNCKVKDELCCDHIIKRTETDRKKKAEKKGK